MTEMTSALLWVCSVPASEHASETNHVLQVQFKSHRLVLEVWLPLITVIITVCTEAFENALSTANSLCCANSIPLFLFLKKGL